MSFIRFTLPSLACHFFDLMFFIDQSSCVVCGVVWCGVCLRIICSVLNETFESVHFSLPAKKYLKSQFSFEEDPPIGEII